MGRGRIGLAIAAMLVVASLSYASLAQDAAVPTSSLAQERQSLTTARRQAREAASRSRQLEAQANQATQDADRASRRAAALAARIQESEAEVQAAQARIAIITRLQRTQAQRLAERQQPIVRLTAALQLLARRPAALAVAQPGSISDAVHVRLVLNAVLPVIRARTAGLRAEIARSRNLRNVAEQAAEALEGSRTQLAARQGELRRLETAKRIASRDYRSSASLESDRALALGERARDIVDLMDELENAGVVRERLATLPGPALRPARPGDVAAPRADFVPFQSGTLAYRLPVVGQLVTGFGEVSESGVRARGLTLATQPNAQVVAPAAGRIAFAGYYRGFGQILIIDHGQGWTTLITNLHRLSVAVGNSVRQGTPVGIAAPSTTTVTVELRRAGRPVNIVPLLTQG
ncbi:MAG: peptidoglycan DD-metalloendopeptidase family protein [Sphingobium sp.]|uniref:murein hydrolase activator EnvC family protein n=1 Tax=Sphingobium sp. TaxID=1912891 RepID=UPI0029B53BDD|nr:peptidoglycan DD-metalloendopeptidase family protein [Sphingobium sp.]MDX3909089.1 peptidoglycan DD-metalloendopeptidase family protein [Sphingobium sp.]